MDCNYGRGVHLRTMLFWNNPFRHYHRLIIILKVIEALQLGHKTPSKTDWSSRAFLTQTHWCCSVSWWRWFVFPVGRNILNITHIFFLLVSTLPKPTGTSWLLLFFLFFIFYQSLIKITRSSFKYTIMSILCHLWPLISLLPRRNIFLETEEVENERSVRLAADEQYVKVIF